MIRIDLKENDRSRADHPRYALRHTIHAAAGTKPRVAVARPSPISVDKRKLVFFIKDGLWVVLMPHSVAQDSLLGRFLPV